MPAPPRRFSNISSPPHGPVCGSEENVEKEEIFLCNRLVDDIQKKGSRELIHFISWNNPVISVLQGIKRPVCGLVALCMAGHMLKKHDPSLTIYTDDEVVLKIARNQGYTKQGEMFSATEYASLAQKIYNCEAEVLNGTLVNAPNKIIEHLSSGFPVLVPYDTDRNFEPCLQKGHKAHWALLTGFVLGIERRKINTNDAAFTVKRLADIEALSLVLKNIAGPLNPSLMYVYAKQGRSARQQLWSFKELSASNANLHEVSPVRDWESYIIPDEGIENTLCKQSVLLFPKSNTPAN